MGQQPGTKSGRRPIDKPVINCWSTAGFVPPSVYIGFPLFVLPRRCSGQLSSVRWGARAAAVSSANRPVGVPSCPLPPRPAAPPWAAPNRSARGMSGFWIRQMTKSLKPGYPTGWIWPGGAKRDRVRRDGGGAERFAQGTSYCFLLSNGLRAV